MAHMNPAGSQKVSANWHGSYPTVIADEGYVPNFRHFDFVLDDTPPSEDLVSRVYKQPEGEYKWGLATLSGSGNVRAAPVVFTSIFGAAISNYMFVKMMGKSLTNHRWTFFTFYAAFLGWNNFTKWYGRERHFTLDWQRNQAYAGDEVKQMRDRQRVREALYAQKFVKNPVAEYRVKQWQLNNNWA